MEGREPTEPKDQPESLNLKKDSAVESESPDQKTPNQESHTILKRFIAGGIAGAVSRTCTAPLDRLKVFVQVHDGKMKLKEYFDHLVKEGKIRGLWRGNGINVLKIAPESAIKFTTYELIKTHFHNTNGGPNFWERFCAGSNAGLISQSVVYPLEVLKTRLLLRKTGEYKNTFDAIRKIVHKEGFKTFYSGYIPNVLGVVPYAGIELAVYETLKKKFLQQHSDQQTESVLLSLGCSTVASVMGQLATYPLALIKTRLQARTVINNEEHTFLEVVIGVYYREGIRGFYRGIIPNFIKVLPAVAINFSVYEYCSYELGVHTT